MLRMEKVNELIKREIGNMILLGDIRDPRVKLVTIQSADTSKDLQHTRVKFSILSDNPADIQAALDGLNSSKSYIRKLLSQKLDMRYTPEVQFFYDKSVQHIAKVDMALEEIKKLKKATGDDDAHDEAL